MEISLTSFADYVMKAGPSKMSIVSKIKKQNSDGYSPAKDYYKCLRDGIIALHKANEPVSKLSNYVSIPHSSREVNYNVMIECYKKFLGKKRISYFSPKRQEWNGVTDLVVHVNPELGLEINGTKYFIKLYFKSDKASKRLSGPILSLMDNQIRKSGVEMALIDIREKKIHVYDSKTMSGLMPLVISEGKSFVSLYNSL